MAEINTSTGDDNTPIIPPEMTSFQNKPANEILSELNKIPLFMTSLEENDDLEAFRALAYEGSPFEVASNFKQQGNEHFKEKKWKDATVFYEKAICLLLVEARKRQNGKNNEAVTSNEIKQEVSVLETCLTNRAACHLQLQNYRSCIQDCEKALQINSRNMKAYYRSSKALLALGKIPEANDACACGLAIDPENSTLKSVSASINQQALVLAEKEQKRLEREKRARMEYQTLNAALLARKITLRKTPNPPEMEGVRIMLVPDPVDPSSTLCFPVLFLYPLHLQSDLIKDFHESQRITDHLEYLLPPPWDSENVYSQTEIEFYIETTNHGLSKVGKKVPLLKVLLGNNIEVVDELVKIFILPRSKSATWIQEFKGNKNR